MAGELAAVLTGLETRLETITGLRVEPEELTNGPAVVLEPQTHDPHSSLSGRATFYVDLIVTIPFGVPRQARKQLISYLEVSGSTSIQATLEADETLGGAAEGLLVKPFIEWERTAIGLGDVTKEAYRARVPVEVWVVYS